jgi:hypothetical protein
LKKWQTKLRVNWLYSPLVPLFLYFPIVTCLISTNFKRDPMTPIHLTICPQQFSLSVGHERYQIKWAILSVTLLPKYITITFRPRLFSQIHSIAKSQPTYSVKKRLSQNYRFSLTIYPFTFEKKSQIRFINFIIFQLKYILTFFKRNELVEEGIFFSEWAKRDLLI